MRFIALYDGRSIGESELIAVTANPGIVDELGRPLAGEQMAVGFGNGAVSDEQNDPYPGPGGKGNGNYKRGSHPNHS